MNYRSTTHPPPESGRNYAYRGIDLDAFLNSSGQTDATSWPLLVDNVRDVVLKFIRSGSVRGWETFPDSSYDVSTVVSNATTLRYLSERCVYWREHGFFPAYAWMN